MGNISLLPILKAVYKMVVDDYMTSILNIGFVCICMCLSVLIYIWTHMWWRLLWCMHKLMIVRAKAKRWGKSEIRVCSPSRWGCTEKWHIVSFTQYETSQLCHFKSWAEMLYKTSSCWWVKFAGKQGRRLGSKSLTTLHQGTVDHLVAGSAIAAAWTHRHTHTDTADCRQMG